MSADYFKHIAVQTPTRLWVNNPTLEEASMAIAAGAISATTNPTYASRLLNLDSGPLSAAAMLIETVRQTPNDANAADLLQQKLVARLLEAFLPLHDQQPGRQGFVSIQGSPHHDMHPESMIAEALEYRKLGRNFIAKIPVTSAGLIAIEETLKAGVPVIATEVMSLAQALAVCEVQKRVASNSTCPPLYLTHITGIFDECIADRVRTQDGTVRAGVLENAGCMLARRILAECRHTGADFVFLGGGARQARHFTEMVGGDMHVTINWSMAKDLLDANLPMTPRFDAVSPPDAIRELRDQVPEFRKAWDADGLDSDEFHEFGPVEFFRRMFIKGWDATIAAAARCRIDQERPK